MGARFATPLGFFALIYSLISLFFLLCNGLLLKKYKFCLVILAFICIFATVITVKATEADDGVTLISGKALSNT